MKSGPSVLALLGFTLVTLIARGLPAQAPDTKGQAPQTKGLSDPVSPGDVKPGQGTGTSPALGDPNALPTQELSAPIKTVPYVNLTNRYIFTERYTKFEERAVGGVVGQYRVGITEVLRDTLDAGSDDPKQTEITRQTLFVERPAEVSNLGIVGATVRNYTRFQVRPDDIVRTTGPKTLDGLTVWYRPQNAENPQIFSLSEDRRLREREYAVAARQVFLPSLTLALPSYPARVGDVWRIPRRAVQALLGESSVRGDTLSGKFTDLLKEEKGPRRIAVFSITGRVVNPYADTAINAEIRFTFIPAEVTPPSANPLAIGSPATNPRSKDAPLMADTREARGAITDLRLARVATGVLGNSKGKPQRYKASQELTLKRQLGVIDNQVLNIPEIPAATDVNTWLTYMDPAGRFFFHHPQEFLPPERAQFVPSDEGANLVTLVKGRPEGPDLIRLSIYDRELKEEDLRGMLAAEWEPTKLELLKGPEEWLPEDEWPGMKVFRVEAALKTRERAKGSSRLHYDAYLLQLGPRLSVLVVATTPRDAVSGFRRDVEQMLKTFKAGETATGKP